MQKATLIIIPTYNERENLPFLVSEILSIDASLQILVIDDGSPDGTGELAESLAAETGRLSVIHRPGKQGLGTAYVAGRALHMPCATTTGETRECQESGLCRSSF